jgi:hypothetical protein
MTGITIALSGSSEQPLHHLKLLRTRRICAISLSRGSENGRQIAVDLEADANLDEDWGFPRHGRFLLLIIREGLNHPRFALVITTIVRRRHCVAHHP